jgi:hypothetical protein
MRGGCDVRGIGTRNREMREAYNYFVLSLQGKINLVKKYLD